MPPPPPSRPSRTVGSRACDSCRRRKVKCDAVEPCANCRISGLVCQYIFVPRQRGPKVRRRIQAEGDIASSPSSVDRQSPYSQASPNTTQRFPHSPVSGTEIPTLREDGGPFPASVDVARPVQTACLTTGDRARAVQNDLLHAITSIVPSLPILAVINTCIDLFIQYQFPACPVVQETALRADASRLFPQGAAPGFIQDGSEGEEVAQMRAFTLLAALCASVASVIPIDLLPCRWAISEPFLNASRAMFKIFEDYDIEHPNSSSLVIRLLLCTALQHITGQDAVAHHILGQASLLVLRMRPYNEDVVNRHDVVEAQLLRSAFWHLYGSDNASLCLRSRPMVLHGTRFEDDFTVRQSGEVFTPLLDVTKPWSREGFEERLLIGFHFGPRLWSSAARLILQIRGSGGPEAPVASHAKGSLTQLHLDFLGIMDEFPHWLQASSLIESSEDSEDAISQRKAYWVQRCTVLVTFQCLRLIILEQCIANQVCEILGLQSEAFSLAMAKLEIVHDFIKTLEDIPFIYLQVKGEANVERIRKVGSTLLEMIDNTDSDTIRTRANKYCIRTLNILARLDSKASEELLKNQNVVV